MPRRNHIPAYRLHKQSGQAIVTLSEGLGGRRDFTLGEFNSPESRAEYARLLGEWEVNGRRLPQLATASADLTLNEVMLAFVQHVEQDYRHPDGSPSRELENVKDALRPVRELYGHTPARDFGPLALKAIQQALIERGLCRNTINRRIGRIKSMFRWALSEELLPPSDKLLALEKRRGLPKGRSAARETGPVKPVADEVVEATLPQLLPMVADMVRLQRQTRMRPGELVVMRGIDLETTGPVWWYRPGSDRGPHGAHKTAHHGHDRAIPIGPRGQEILRKYLKLDLSAYLFSPQDALAERRAEQRRNRKTKVQPSQQNRRRRQPKRTPGCRYRVGSYATAIRRAVKAANRGRLCDACKAATAKEPCDACRGNQLPHWHPHQLRHTKATEIRREFGLDAARAVLGHRSPRVTEVYAEIDMNKAAEVMAQLG
jgi:integrase